MKNFIWIRPYFQLRDFGLIRKKVLCVVRDGVSNYIITVLITKINSLPYCKRRVSLSMTEQMWYAFK